MYRFNNPNRPAAFILLAFCLIAGSWSLTSQGQESIRMSLSGADAAEHRRKARMTPGYYNINLGRTWWRFGAGLASEFNDNVRYSNDQDADFILRPSGNVEFFFPVTEQNSLNFRVDGGYSAYVDNSDLSRWYITPGSELSFDVYVGDVWLNLHDRFSLIQDAYLDPTVAGYGDLARFENAIGLSGLWDLNRLLVRGGYDHLNYISVSGENTSRQPDGQSEVFFASVGYEMKRQMLLGVETGFGLVDYDATGFVIFTEAVQWNTGVFFETPVSDYIRIELGGGYTLFDPELRPGVTLEDDLKGFYARAIVRHRLNQYVDYSLSAGRNISFAFYGGTIDLWYTRLQANWKVFEKVNLSTSFDFDGGTQYDYGIEDFTRVGGGITASRPITQKLTASLGYQVYVRDSDLSSRDYTVNIATLGANYRF